MLNKMKKTVTLITLLILTIGAFAQSSYDGYVLRSRHYTKVDSVLILNSTNVQIDTATLASGQFLQYDGSRFTNVAAAPGVDSLTNSGDGWIRIYYGGNVVDSAYFEQAVVYHDNTLIGLGTADSVLRVDTSELALKTWVQNLVITSNGYVDENAMDAVGNILDTVPNGDVKFHYDDANDSIWAEVADDSHNHTISNIDNLQDSLDAKQYVITGAATTIDTEDLTANRALISNSSGKVAVSSTISSTELGYLDNATGNIQTQIDNLSTGVGADTIYTEDDNLFPIEYLKYHIASSTISVTDIAKPDGIFFGGIVTWLSDLDFAVSPAAYYINGSLYTTNDTTITLTDSDGSNNRIDLFVVDTLGRAGYITGTAGTNPTTPQYNSRSQLPLTSVLILANDSIPSQIGGDSILTEVVYNENVEWTTADSGFTVDFASATEQYIGTFSASAGTTGSGDYISFSNAVDKNFSDYETFSMWLQLKETISFKDNINVQFFLDSIAVTVPYPVIFDPSIITWQNIGFAISELSPTSASFDEIRITYDPFKDVTFSGYYLDYVTLQGGIIAPVYEGDDWGDQVVVSDTTLTGVGTTISPLKVDTTIIATRAYVENNDNQTAAEVSYSNTTSGLSATNVQSALDEIDNTVDGLIAGTGDNWGLDTVVHDNTLLGEGTFGDGLKVDTTVISTKAYAESLASDDQVAAEVNISDAGGYFNGTEVETALQELGSAIASGGDNWGSQKVVSDSTLTGGGVTGDSLSVDKTGDWTGTLDGYEGSVLAQDNQVALEVNIYDLGAYFASTQVEGALQELAAIDASFSTLISNNTDSLAVHRTELNAHSDSITALRADIDAFVNTDDQTAAEVNISDAGGYYTATTVEGALAEIASTGGWDYGVQALSGTTPTLNANHGLNATITLSGNTDITFSNLVAGMTGNIVVTCSASGYTLEFSGYTIKVSPYLESTAGVITTTATGSAVDVYSYFYTGSVVIINGTKNYD